MHTKHIYNFPDCMENFKLFLNFPIEKWIQNDAIYHFSFCAFSFQFSPCIHDPNWLFELFKDYWFCFSFMIIIIIEAILNGLSKNQDGEKFAYIYLYFWYYLILGKSLNKDLIIIFGIRPTNNHISLGCNKIVCV